MARWILDKAGNQKPLKRLWISSVTDKAIREAFSESAPRQILRATVPRCCCPCTVRLGGRDQCHQSADLQIQCTALLRTCPDPDTRYDRCQRRRDPHLCRFLITDSKLRLAESHLHGQMPDPALPAPLIKTASRRSNRPPLRHCL